MTGYAIVLASGELERLQAVANIASVAAVSEIPVDVFATMDGLEAFDEEIERWHVDAEKDTETVEAAEGVEAPETEPDADSKTT